MENNSKTLRAEGYVDEIAMAHEPSAYRVRLMIERKIHDIQQSLDFEMVRPAWERFRAAMRGMKL